MIHEFAVDPEALAGWQNFRYLVEKFGVSQGRLISRFPKDWKRMVYEACDACPPMEKARIVEKLNSIDSKLFHAGRIYDKGRSWIPNTVTSHSGSPFQAIITHKKNAGSDGFLDVDALSDDNETWAVPRGRLIPRTAADMAAAAEKLLRCSAEIIFVDPHFGGEARFSRPLTAMIRCACNGRVPRRLEYHLSAKDVTDITYRSILERRRDQWAIPSGVRIVFVRWNQLDEGDTLHSRYVLTEKGGLRYDHGLDEGNLGETTDVECLDQAIHTHRWQQFQVGSGYFELADAWIVTSASVVKATWDGSGFVAEVR